MVSTKFQPSLEQIKYFKYKKPISSQELLTELQQYHIPELLLKEQQLVTESSILIFTIHYQIHQPKQGKKCKKRSKIIL